MYAFYADESGFSKSTKFEIDQPILVVVGILIDTSKLRKAIEVFDDILLKVNALLNTSVQELKFTEIRNKYPYKIDLPKVEERADLLENIILDFQKEIDFKVFYCAIDNQRYFNARKTEELLKKRLKHPYLCASYKILSQLDKHQAPKPRNKGKTFVIFDEQNQYQNDIEELVHQPLHIQKFSEIFDTTYFGKSHYSKLIQIADLIAGTIRYYLTQLKQGKTPKTDYWVERIEAIIQKIAPNVVQKDCFANELKTVYQAFELQLS
jgi:Protein of unknown function (DUF3800)